MKQIIQYINDSLISKNSNIDLNPVDLSRKIKLALNFNESVFKDIDNIYYNCWKYIKSFVTDELEANDIDIYITSETWENKIKDNPSYEKYKKLFIIDDDKFNKINNKYGGNNLYFYSRGEIILAANHPIVGYAQAIYFEDDTDEKNFIQCWFVNPKIDEALIKKDVKIDTSINPEFSPKDKRAYGKFGERWFDKCKGLAYAGNWKFTQYTYNDFKGFTKDFENNFIRIPCYHKSMDHKSKIRYEMCQLLNDEKIDEMLKLADNNDIEYFAYGAHEDTDYIYGSYMYDTYMYIKTYELIKSKSSEPDNLIWNNVFDINSSRVTYWTDKYKSVLKNMLSK